MEYRLVHRYEERILKEVARLHYDALSYRSFITIFGNNFLLEIYKGILASPIGFFIIAQKNSQISGFVLCCYNSDRLVTIMLKNGLNFLRIIIPRLIQEPVILKKLIETSLYFQKDSVSVKPELLVIAVKEEFRDKRIGAALIKQLENQFRKKSIRQYKVTVHNAMTGSNRFYLENGMQLAKKFKLYNTQWNLFTKTIL